MMEKGKGQNGQRRSVRFAGYDYRLGGAYFVTICAAQRRMVFGRIENAQMRLHPYGRIAVACWEEVNVHFPHVALDEFVVMPNHFHAIVMLQENAPNISTPQTGQFARPVAGSLATIVANFKAAVTRNINRERTKREMAPVVVWQRNYHEHIIRHETELNDTRRYIIENPLHWGKDDLHMEAER